MGESVFKDVSEERPRRATSPEIVLAVCWLAVLVGCLDPTPGVAAALTATGERYGSVDARDKAPDDGAAPGFRPVPAIPPSRREMERMGAWHRRHKRVMDAVNRAWLRALRANDRVLWKDPAPDCRALRETLWSPEMKGLLAAPDPVLRLHLGRSVDELRVAAAACASGRYFESAHRFREAGKAFLQVGALMTRYELHP